MYLGETLAPRNPFQPGTLERSQRALTFFFRRSHAAPPDDARLNGWDWRAIGRERETFFRLNGSVSLGYRAGSGGKAVLSAGSASSIVSVKSSALIRGLLAPKNNITCLPIRETDKS